MTDTSAYEGMIAETITVQGDGGDRIHAYLARPLGEGPFPAMLLLHHIPGWDEFYRETARRYAHHGYVTIAPDLYCRDGHGEPEDVAAKVRAEGGAPDDRVVGDADGAIAFLRSLPYVTGKVGVMGTCSGGRHSFLVACRSQEGVDAVVDCWGGNVVMPPRTSPSGSQSRPSTTPPTSTLRCSASSARTTSAPPPSRSPCMRRR